MEPITKPRPHHAEAVCWRGHLGIWLPACDGEGGGEAERGMQKYPSISSSLLHDTKHPASALSITMGQPPLQCRGKQESFLPTSYFVLFCFPAI